MKSHKFQNSAEKCKKAMTHESMEMSHLHEQTTFLKNMKAN